MTLSEDKFCLVR